MYVSTREFLHYYLLHNIHITLIPETELPDTDIHTVSYIYIYMIKVRWMKYQTFHLSFLKLLFILTIQVTQLHTVIKYYFQFIKKSNKIIHAAVKDFIGCIDSCKVGKSLGQFMLIVR